MLRNEAIELCRKLTSGAFMVLDTETTGLSDQDQPIEIAMLENHDVIIFHALAKPDVPIHEKAQAVHGLTAEMLASEAPISEVAQKLQFVLDAISDQGTVNTILIHNASFDIRMLSRVGVKIPSGIKVIDTLPIFRAILPSGKLDGGHRAIADCEKLIDKIREFAKLEIDEAIQDSDLLGLTRQLAETRNARKQAEEREKELTAAIHKAMQAEQLQDFSGDGLEFALSPTYKKVKVADGFTIGDVIVAYPELVQPPQPSKLKSTAWRSIPKLIEKHGDIPQCLTCEFGLTLKVSDSGQ